MTQKEEKKEKTIDNYVQSEQSNKTDNIAKTECSTNLIPAQKIVESK